MNTHQTPHLRTYTLAFGLLGLISIAIIGFKLWHAPRQPQQTNAQLSSTYNWIIDNNGYTKIQRANSAALTPFNNPSTFYIPGGTRGISTGAAADQSANHAESGSFTTLKDYTSFATFSADVANRKTTAADKWVLYDIEDWKFTPVSETAEPAKYIGQFVTLAHQTGLKVIMSPSDDLMAYSHSGTTAADRYRLYLASDVPAASSQADIYLIQAQGQEEYGTQQYVTDVQDAIKAARTAPNANPNLVFWGDVTTQRVCDAQQIANDVRATKAIGVQGNWFNVFQDSKCADGGAKEAIATLKNLGYNF